MRRDPDLIRHILLRVAEHEDPQEWMDPDLGEWSADQVSYHVQILDQAGLLEGWNRSAIGVFRWSARNLTWQGHQLLDAARNEDVWRQAKARLDEHGVGYDFDLVLEVLRDVARSRLRP